MSEASAGTALRDAVWLLLLLGGPVLVVSLVIGLLVSLLQAVTQVNEPTLAFMPKALLVGATLFLLGPFMSSQLAAYARGMMDQLIVVGGR